MTIHRLATTLAATALLAASSLAIARGPVGHLSERLDLDDEQAATIAALFEEHRDHMRHDIEWRDADGQLDPEALDRARAAREALQEEILAVLDPEQAERFERMSERRGILRGGGRMARVFDSFDLSEEQKTALRVLKAEHRVQRMNRREAFLSELASILDADQLAELEQMRRSQRKGRNH